MNYAALSTTEIPVSVRPDIARRLQRAKNYVETHFDRQIGLNDMAGQAFMSSAHFLRQFKREFGSTPYQYLTQCRLQAAKKLLRETDTAITEIVFASGFGNRSAFSRLFKERCGVSPLEYRRINNP